MEANVVDFPAINSPQGLTYLDQYLNTRSYISDHAPTQNDVTLFRAFNFKEPSHEYCNILRWYRHIQSFGNQQHRDFPVSESVIAKLESSKPATEPAAEVDFC